MLDIAVIIVTWNVRDLVLDALRSLYEDLAQSGLLTQVYVVDSASSDGTPEAVAEAFPQVKLIVSPENIGFGRANNIGMRAAGIGTPDAPHAVYLLNPDTISQPGSTRALYETLMAHPDVGLVGARLLYGDGSFQHGAFAFPGLRQLWAEFFPTPGRLIEGTFNGRYPRHLYESGKPFEIGFPLGATMMLKHQVIEQVGMFDEQFFMYAEEVDWAWRIRKAGWKVMCVPVARVVHLVGQSTGQMRVQSFINLWESRLKLFRKHYPAWKLALARRLIALGMAQKAQREPDEEIRAAYLKVKAMAENF
jgi:N-acetylglucosaminyl-diphospho-decaprenol L-rhamnosyltransferase